MRQPRLQPHSATERGRRAREGELGLAIQGMSAISVYSPPPNVSDTTRNASHLKFWHDATIRRAASYHPIPPLSPPFQLQQQALFWTCFCCLGNFITEHAVRAHFLVFLACKPKNAPIWELFLVFSAVPKRRVSHFPLFLFSLFLLFIYFSTLINSFVSILFEYT